MADLPAHFQFLNKLVQPFMIVEAVKLYGTLETPGEADNPTILEWAKETGLDKAGYIHDSIPWCGLFMAVVAQRSGKLLPPDPLLALSWAKFGAAAISPALGDVMVYKRFDSKGKLIGGHVNLYVAEDKFNFYGLGANQNDAVNIIAKPRAKLFACRRPVYHTQPQEVKPIIIDPTVAVNTNPVKEV